MSENYDFFFGAGKPQLNNEFRILSNKDKSDKEYEYLIFTDSKGNCEENFYSWVDQLTDKLKIKPLEKWIKPDLDKGIKITSYVAIRFDEKYREGHQSRHENYTVKLPFMDDKIDNGKI